tara:strand:+ start:348 stop:632 length:285 start_codon:yes stop_codon:yes gene_type:complete
MNILIENLKNLSNQILSAKKIDDYDEIIKVDKMRKILIDEVFSRGLKALSEEDIKTIKLIAEENENLVAEISIASTMKIQSANKKMKAIKGYNF